MVGPGPTAGEPIGRTWPGIGDAGRVSGMGRICPGTATGGAGQPDPEGGTPDGMPMGVLGAKGGAAAGITGRGAPRGGPIGAGVLGTNGAAVGAAAGIALTTGLVPS